MIYILAAIGLPTIVCMIHAFVTDDQEAVRGGLVLLGLTLALCVVLVPVIGVD